VVPSRNLALDVFRGMTVCFMILVNNPGSWATVYAPLLHAPWHGFTPTDLVFPSFLFAVGISMAFSLTRFEQQSHAEFLKHVVKRSVIIFLIGLLLHLFPFYTTAADGSIHFKSLEKLRIFGVLQRIAVCYLAAWVLIRFAPGWRTLLGLCGFALLSYWGLSLYFSWPGDDPYGLVNNAARRLDLMLLGDKHLWHGEGIAFDPEGILSSVPATVNVVAGYLIGGIIRSTETFPWKKVIILSITLMGIALLWSFAWPINKKIWTGSYTLLTVGLDMLLLVALHFLVSQRQPRWTYFFTVFGKNPLFIFVFSGVLIITLYRIKISGTSVQQLMYTHAFANWLPPHTASLGFAVLFTLLCWGVGVWLDKKRIYIKV
jgi:predicted acyltransferase